MFDPLSVAVTLMATTGSVFVLNELKEEIGAAAGTGEERTTSARTALTEASSDADFQRELSNYERSLVAAQLPQDIRDARIASAIAERSNTLDIESKIPEGFAAPNEMRMDTIKRFQASQVEGTKTSKFDKQVEARMFAQQALPGKTTPEAANVLLNATAGLDTPLRETPTPQPILDNRAKNQTIEKPGVTAIKKTAEVGQSLATGLGDVQRAIVQPIETAEELKKRKLKQGQIRGKTV